MIMLHALFQASCLPELRANIKMPKLKPSLKHKSRTTAV